MNRRRRFVIINVSFHIAAINIAACLLIACEASHKTVGSPVWRVSYPEQCRELETKWESLKSSIKGDSVSGRIARIREASSQFIDDPEDCVTHLIDEALKNELRKVVVLEIGSKRYEAIAIYTCQELQDGIRCAGRSADDTAHLGEAPDLKTTPTGVTAHLKMITDYPLKGVKVYFALDRELMDEPRKSAHPVELKSDGDIQLPGAARSNILFVIAQEKYQMFHKWVWLLR